MATRDVESFADFCQYYAHKFVRSSKDPHLMYFIHGAVDNRRCSMSVYKDGRSVGELVMADEEIWASMQFGLPTIGMTVYNDAELMYLFYRTARSGGRGFCRDRIVTHSFNGYGLEKAGLVKVGEDLATAVNAWLALTPRYVTLEHAFEDLQSQAPKRLAYALSQRFGVYLAHNKDNPQFCYKMYAIGEVLGPNKVSLNKIGEEYKDVVLRSLNRNMEIEIHEAR